MRRSVKAFISRGEAKYVAECLEIGVVTQGATLDETISNLQEAVALFLEGEDPAEFDLDPNPSLLITYELEPAHHVR
ncbi:MAG: type II toxin-antitoxin system HicB family antitoxin [Planctomycetes bacterium]|nr:type II toxin-antitoxin system HicB family antitoxin [Planctomycetota bacterium]